MSEAPMDWELSKNLKAVLANTGKASHWNTASDRLATPTLSAAMELPEVRALVAAGDVMANALRGGYIVSGSAGAWQAALAPFKDAKP